eukprot:gene11949-12703_t
MAVFLALGIGFMIHTVHRQKEALIGVAKTEMAAFNRGGGGAAALSGRDAEYYIIG